MSGDDKFHCIIYNAIPFGGIRHWDEVVFCRVHMNAQEISALGDLITISNESWEESSVPFPYLVYNKGLTYEEAVQNTKTYLEEQLGLTVISPEHFEKLLRSTPRIKCGYTGLAAAKNRGDDGVENRGDDNMDVNDVEKLYEDLGYNKRLRHAMFEYKMLVQAMTAELKYNCHFYYESYHVLDISDAYGRLDHIKQLKALLESPLLSPHVKSHDVPLQLCEFSTYTGK